MRKAFGPLPVLTLWIKTLLCMFGRMYQFQCHNQPTRSQLKTRKESRPQPILMSENPPTNASTEETPDRITYSPPIRQIRRTNIVSPPPSGLERPQQRLTLETTDDSQALAGRQRHLFQNRLDAAAQFQWSAALRQRLLQGRLGLFRKLLQLPARLLAGWIGVPYEEVSYRVAGINHQAWFLELRHRGEDAYPRLRERIHDADVNGQEPVR